MQAYCEHGEAITDDGFTKLSKELLTLKSLQLLNLNFSGTRVTQAAKDQIRQDFITVANVNIQ